MLRRSIEHARILRQKIVSSAKLRGFTNEEITQLLAEKGVTNPRTGDPYTIQTVAKDINELEGRWMSDMLSDVSSHRSRVLAELRETKAAAWKAGNFNIILRAIDQEAKLLGLNELERMNVEIALANLFKGFPEEVAEKLKGLVAKKVLEKKGQKQITAK